MGTHGVEDPHESELVPEGGALLAVQLDELSLARCEVVERAVAPLQPIS